MIISTHTITEEYCDGTLAIYVLETDRGGTKFSTVSAAQEIALKQAVRSTRTVPYCPYQFLKLLLLWNISTKGDWESVWFNIRHLRVISCPILFRFSHTGICQKCKSTGKEKSWVTNITTVDTVPGPVLEYSHSADVLWNIRISHAPSPKGNDWIAIVPQRATSPRFLQLWSKNALNSQVPYI